MEPDPLWCGVKTSLDDEPYLCDLWLLHSGPHVDTWSGYSWGSQGNPNL